MADVKFYTVEEFKAALGVTTVKVVKNPKTEKLFCIADDLAIKCQQSIDLGKPLAFICSEFDKKGNAKLDEACLINVEEGKGLSVLATL